MDDATAAEALRQCSVYFDRDRLPSFCNAAWLPFRTTITINHTSLKTSKCR